uniref:Alcohol dehydrogenase n=1 Tax=Stomoxys calcitrans TaxID=35570 RepID=A0A1I8Q1Q6_STOCA
MQLQGKNVIYVGGFGGIGQKCVEAFLEKSVKHLLIFDLTSNDEFLKYLQETYKDSSVGYIPVDITKSESISRAFQEAKDNLGSFDVVVNGAGIIDESNIELLLQINATGLMQSSLIAMEHMSKANGGQGGCIVNISSTAGLDATELFCIYSPAKCAVTAFTRAMAHRTYFEKTGVSFITICPGATDTSLLRSAASKIYSARYIPNIADVFATIKVQTPTTCAKNLIQVLETASNGTIWALDDGVIRKVDFPQVWESIAQY